MSWRKPGEHVGSGDAFARCVRDVSEEYEEKMASGSFKPRKPLPRGLTREEKAQYIAERTCAKIGRRKYGADFSRMAHDARKNPTKPPQKGGWSPGKIIAVGAAVVVVAYGAVTVIKRTQIHG